MSVPSTALEKIRQVFSEDLTLPLDAALALYSNMEVKSPGLVYAKKKNIDYPTRIKSIIEEFSGSFVPSGYSLAAETLSLVSEFIRKNSISRVLEFGSGISTLTLPCLFPGQFTTYLSIEEDYAYGSKIREILSSKSVYDNTSVRVLPVEHETSIRVNRQNKKIRVSQFKDLSQTVSTAFSNSPPEVVLIDGPSGRCKWGRFSALFDISSILGKGVFILLDDALRYREISILDEWRRQGIVEVYGIHVVGTGLGLAVTR